MDPMICPLCNSSSNVASDASGKPPSFAYEPTDREKELATLQENIDSLVDLISACSRKLSTMRSRQNDLRSTWYSLPPELLVIVIDYMADREDFKQRTSLDWIVITHICSRWRQLALQTPRLWSRPYLRNFDCARTMVERASASQGPQRLIFDLPLNHSNWRWNIDSYVNVRKIVFDHLGRAEALIIRDDQEHGGLEEFTDDLEHFTDGQPHPRFLESLVIEAESCSSQKFPLSLLWAAAGGLDSGLRNITLRNWNLFNYSGKVAPLLVPTLLNLRSVHIELIRWESSQQVAPTQVLQMLKKMPQLEVLSLKNVFARMRAGDPSQLAAVRHPGGAVEFPSMTQLILTGSVAGCSIFLENVDLPLSATLSVHCDQESSEWAYPDYVRLLQALSAKLRNGIHTLRLESQEGAHTDTARLEAWQNIGQHEVNLWKPDIVLYTPPATFKGMQSFVSEGLQILPLDDLDQMYYLLRSSDTFIWKKCSRLPKLCTLAIRHHHLEFLNVLGCPLIDHPAHTTTLIPFPTLETLVLQNADFGLPFSAIRESLESQTSDSPSSEVGPTRLTILDAFVEAIRKRRQLGLGPGWLDLVNCMGLSKEDNQLLVGLFEGVGMMSKDDTLPR